MKINKSLSTYFLCFQIITTIIFTPSANAQVPADPSSIIGKVVCGYQGWFSCAGDGSPINTWFHWSGTTMPAPGHLSFEVYPDVSIYNSPDLFLTGFSNQGDGQPSRLFSSYKQNVVNKHFELMQTHGIDGVALQRFISEILSSDPHFKENRDAVALNVKNSAEAYSRLFYVTYDLSGLSEVPGLSDAQRYDAIKTDWQNTIVNNLHLTSSAMYAHQNLKPVVQLWGIGFTHVIGNATLALDLINWFKAQGCYVIGGVPTNWRTCTSDSRPGYENVYKAFNMISPWTVGRFSDITGVNTYKTSYLIPDQTYCNTNGMAFMPVTFPGFAWSNWVAGGTKNQIPRNKGEFLWRQIYNIKSLSIPSVYMAMFDEYDEGTALLNMADGFSMIPTNQYFLTSSADGTYISSDFYLRLTGKATKVIKGIDPVTTNVTIPFSTGPVYFRTSVESTIDATPTWTSTIEYKTNVTNYGSNSGNPACAVVTDNHHKGSSAIRIQGRDRSTASSYAYFKVFDVNIPVSSTMQLSFWSYPTTALGRYVSVDLIMTDGSTLRDCGALDIDGISMHPGAGRGTIATWTKTTSVIGTWLNGKTIDRILIAYDHATETGDFRAYIDDISFDTGIPLTSTSWTGITSTNWFEKTNWSIDLVPSSSTDIYISAGAPNLPAINATGAECRDITLTIPFSTSSTTNLSVYGDWRANDNLTMPDFSTVIFKGASGKIIDGYTYFYNLIIDKADPAFTLTDEGINYPKTSVEVRNNLTITKGHLILNGTDWRYYISNNLTIASTGTLSSNHTDYLEVKGSWTNNGGTYYPGTGLGVLLNGSATQTIGGSAATTFNNLTIDNGAGVLLTSTAIPPVTVVSNMLTINSGKKLLIPAGKALTVEGTFINNAVGGLVIKSDATGTGSFINYSSNSGTGTSLVERYIPNDWKWHFLSSPVATQAIWPEFAPTPSGSPLSFGASSWNWDFYYWNPNASLTNALYWANLRKTNGAYNDLTIDQSGSYAGFGATTQPEFTIGRGYLVSYNTGWNPATGSPSTHTFSGTLNSGTINRSIVTGANTFNLVGNPYASSIDWKSSNWGTSRNNLVLSGSGYDYWIWNDATGNYGVFNSAGTSGTNGVSQYIAPEQAFFIKASTDGMLGMNNSIRCHSVQSWLKEEEIEVNLIHLKLTTDANNFSDELIVEFNPLFIGGGSDKFWSFYTEAPEIYAVKDDNSYSIDRYNSLNEGLIVNIAVKTGVDAEYTIAASNISDFDISDKVFLEDLKTGTITNLKATPNYKFTGGPEDERNRFRLSIGKTTGIEKPSPNDFNIYAFNNILCVENSTSVNSYTLLIYNSIGQAIFNKKLTGNTQNHIEIGQAPGVYIVTVVAEGRKTSKKVVIR